MPEHHQILLRMSKEPVFLKYTPVDIAIRSVPGEELTVYAKVKGGPEHLFPHTMEIMKTAIRDCIEISKEEYDSF